MKEHAPTKPDGGVVRGAKSWEQKIFCSLLEKSGTKVLRIVNSDDPIMKVPGFVVDEKKAAAGARVVKWVQRRMEKTQWVYAEIGKKLRVNSRDCLHLSKGSVATCHNLKTYLHLVDTFVSSNCPLKATARKVLERAQEEVFC